MAFYDTLGPATQLGGDLQNYSSNGWNPPVSGTPNSGGPTFWDGVTHSSFPSPVSVTAPNMTDMVVYQGELHVVWVEPQWNGSQDVMRGPFVKKWDGASWVALGGEVDPAISPVVWVNNPDPGAVGNRGAPARPHIVTDGTSLFVAYTVREVVHGAVPPPNGSWVPGQACGCYVGTCDHTDYTIWHPRKTYVRKWNPGTGLWDLFGELPPLTNNALNIGNVSVMNSVVNLHAWASAGESDTVYVTMWESGCLTAMPNYSLSPSCIFGIQFGTATNPPQYRGLRTAQFTTATGTAGVVKDLFTQSYPQGTQLPVNDHPLISTDAYIGNNSGTPFLFYNDLSVTPNVLHMRNWNTLVDAQTLSGATYSSVNAPYGLAHEDDNSTYYLATPFVSGPVVEVLDDGTGPIQPLDFAAYGTTYWYATPNGFFSDKLAPEMTQGNLWAVYQENFEQFHHNCPAWENRGFMGSSSVTQRHVGEAYPVLVSPSLYGVCGFRDPTNTAVDYSVQVYQASICRSCASCGEAVDIPYLDDTFSTGATGSGATAGTSSDPYLAARFSVGGPAAGVTGAAANALYLSTRISTI